MSPARFSKVPFARVRALLEAALELEPPQRNSFVHGETTDEPWLRAEVLELLGLDGKDLWLEPQSTPLSRLLESRAELELPDELTPGTRLGVWRIVSLLGRGGMGAVYRVERVEGGFLQVAALKVIGTASDSPALLQRFSRERELLASFEHPAIARLIDGGADAQGTPYLVLELVEGRPIDAFCDARGLSVKTRVTLFCEVCAAIDHAHRHLVVHRDIKPANVLVTAAGAVKLLDFGIAGLLGDDRDEVAHAFLTPRFASPEQLAGARPTTASDVYSLGVLLHGLLCGAWPDATATGSTPQLPSRIGLGSSERAALRGTRPARLARILRGDLDAIVLRALDEDPARRYPSAAALADDLGRWLDSKPVAARESDASYVLARLLTRHRGVAIASGLAIAALIVGLFASLLSARRAETAREISNARLEDVTEIAFALLGDVQNSLRELPGATPARRVLVDTALARLTDLEQQVQADPRVLHALAAAWLRLAELQGARATAHSGDFVGARESASRSVALYRTVGELLPQDPMVACALSQALRVASDLARTAGELEHARHGYAESVSEAERGLALAPQNADLARNQRLAREGIGRVALLAGHAGTALTCFDSSLAELGEFAANGLATELLRDRIGLEHLRGTALARLGRRAEACASFETALVDAQTLLARMPCDPGASIQLVRVAVERAEIGLDLGELDLAARDVAAAVEQARMLIAKDAGNDWSQTALESALAVEGRLAAAKGDADRARASYDEAIASMELRLARAGGENETAWDAAFVFLQRGAFRLAIDNPASAREDFERVAQLLDTQRSPTARDANLIAVAAVNEAETWLREGDLSRAETILQRARERLEPWLAAFAELDWPERQAGLIAYGLGRIEEARSAAAQERALRRSSLIAAREHFQRGYELSRSMERKQLLLPSEVDVPALFQQDVKRCEDALARRDDP